MDYFIELFFSGLTRGSIYALIALGYTMVYGIIGLINFAHGEIYMIGAFTALIVSSVLSIYNMPLLAIIVLTVMASAIWASAYGYTIEKLAYKPLRKAPRLSPLISAIGMSISCKTMFFLPNLPISCPSRLSYLILLLWNLLPESLGHPTLSFWSQQQSS